MDKLTVDNKEINNLDFYVANKLIVHIYRTETGFGVAIAEDMTMDEAATQFIFVLRDQLKNMKNLVSAEGSH